MSTVTVKGGDEPYCLRSASDSDREDSENAETSQDFDANELLTTGEVARQAQTTLRTVRFYEEAELIQAVPRSTGGQRLFTRQELLKLKLIVDLRDAGLSLDEIKQLFALKAKASCAVTASEEMSGLLKHTVDDLQRKIIVLQRVQEELLSMIAQIANCKKCDDPAFPRACPQCPTISKHPVSRALRLLWKL